MDGTQTEERQPLDAATSEIRELNEAYINAFVNCDAGWFQEHLAPDFKFIDRAGNLIKKPAFLESTRAGNDVGEYVLDEVGVDLFGPTAIVRAVGRFRRSDGSTGASRYADVYVRSGERWLVVSAQVTPVLGT